VQKQKRKKIIVTFLIIYVISIGSSWGYFFYVQDADHDKRVIREFSSSDPKFSEIYQVENLRLVNMVRESYIFPNDRLEYRFTINNPLDQNIRVSYDFEVFTTAEHEREFQDKGEWFIRNLQTEHKQLEFFLKEEKPYDLKLNLIFYNSTDDKIAQFPPIEKDIPVLSLANKLQDDANQLTYKGFIAVSIVGIGTIIALVTNVIFSKLEVDKLDTQNQHSEDQIELLKKQNDDLKEQQSIQNRPWISVIANNPVRIDGESLQIQFENYGKTIATKIITTSLIKKGEITKEVLIKDGESLTGFDMSPKEIFSHYLPIPSDVDPAIGIHFGILIQYEFEQTKKGESILIANWNDSVKKAFYEIKKLD